MTRFLYFYCIYSTFECFCFFKFLTSFVITKNQMLSGSQTGDSETYLDNIWNITFQSQTSVYHINDFMCTTVSQNLTTLETGKYFILIIISFYSFYIFQIAVSNGDIFCLNSTYFICIIRNFTILSLYYSVGSRVF